MTHKEATEIIEELLLYHRQTHITWLEFFNRNPHREAEFTSGTGDRKCQKNYIAAYDKALKALEVLRGNER